MTTIDTSVGQAEIDFNPFVSPHREDPHLFYRVARARPPQVSPFLGAYLVSRYDDIQTVLGDPDTYVSTLSVPRIYGDPLVDAVLRRGNVPDATMVVTADEPAHLPMRRVFEAGFTGARVRAMLPTIHATADALIDAFPADGVDLVGAYAVPFVKTVISAIIGFPAEDTARVQAWTDHYATLLNVLAPVEQRVAAAEHMGDYTRYLQALIDERRARPRADLLSDLVHGSDGHPGMPDDSIQCSIRGDARLAGFDTTRDAITSTMLAVLRDPAVRERVLADPVKMIPRATEESLRHEAPHRGLFRTTSRDTELGGTALPAGAQLLLLFGSGNRDEAVFPAADVFDLDRPNAREHLAFGEGLHVCPGRPMARAEIRVALEHLIRRFPTMRLAEGYEPTYILSYLFRGLTSLDVTW